MLVTESPNTIPLLFRERSYEHAFLFLYENVTVNYKTLTEILCPLHLVSNRRAIEPLKLMKIINQWDVVDVVFTRW